MNGVRLLQIVRELKAMGQALRPPRNRPKNSPGASVSSAELDARGVPSGRLRTNNLAQQAAAQVHTSGHCFVHCCQSIWPTLGLMCQSQALGVVSCVLMTWHGLFSEDSCVRQAAFGAALQRQSTPRPMKEQASQQLQMHVAPASMQASKHPIGVSEAVKPQGSDIDNPGPGTPPEPHPTTEGVSRKHSEDQGIAAAARKLSGTHIGELAPPAHPIQPPPPQQPPVGVASAFQAAPQNPFSSAFAYTERLNSAFKSG
jgi:hypothetical protein